MESTAQDVAVSKALELVCGDSAGKVLVLASAFGSDRDAFLATLVVKSSARGQAVDVLDLLLDGFEPERGGVEAFVAFVLTETSTFNEETRGALQAWAKALVTAQPIAATSGIWACIAALAMQLPEAAAAAWAIAAAATAASDSADDAWAKLLAAVPSDDRVVVHVPGESTLADPVCLWLLNRIKLQTRSSLVFSCAPSTSDDDLVLAMRAACVPVRIDVPTRIRGRDIESALEAWLPSLGEDAAAMRGFLSRAALCGPNVAVKLLLAASGVAPDRFDHFIDAIDEHMASAERHSAISIFADLGFRHPGFPATSIYRFRSQAAVEACATLGDKDGEQKRVEELQAFVSQHVRTQSRGCVQLLVHLFEQPAGKITPGPRHRQKTWVGLAEAEAMRAMLASDVNEGRLPGDALLATAQRDVSAPPHQRLVWLEASAARKEGLDVSRAVPFFALRADLLGSMGRFDDAIASAQQCLSLVPDDHAQSAALRGMLMFLTGRCHRASDRPREAAGAFAIAADATQRMGATEGGAIDWHNVGACHAEAGRCHADLGELEQACALLSLAVTEMQRGDARGQTHADQVKLVTDNLKACEAQRAKLSAAKPSA